MIRRAVTLALAGLLALVPAAGAQGGLGFKASAEGPAPRDGYLAFDLAAGGSATGAFLVTNTTSATATVAIYPSDALTGATTGIVFGNEATRERAGAWITPDQSAATVGPGQERLVRFTVRVPGGTPAGQHVGAVVIQQRRAGSATVAQVVRVVAPVLVEVGGGGGAQIQLDSARIGAAGTSGMTPVGIGMRNTGAQMCSPRLSVTVAGLNESGRTVTRQLDTVLARDGVTYAMPWSRALTPGSYRIAVTATGCGATQTRTFTDTVPSGGEAGTTPVPPGTGGTRRRPSATENGQPGSSSQATQAPPKITLRQDPGQRAQTPAPGGGGAAATGSEGAASDRTGEEDTSLPDEVRELLSRHGGEALRRAGAPIALLLVFGLVVVAQEAVDRRDPKLRLAPVHRDPDLPFGPEPDPEPVGHPSNFPPELRVRQ